jgi:hypothetical protein
MTGREAPLDDRADQIARDFISRYEAEWSNGAEAVQLISQNPYRLARDK